MVGVLYTLLRFGADGRKQWPLSWRIAILINVSFCNMMGNVFAAGISPLFSLLMQDLHCTATEVSRLPGYALLMLGLAVSPHFLVISAECVV